MDPLTQGVLGASLSLSKAKKQQIYWAGLCGLIGGIAPDIDTFIRSEQDPLLYLEYHRHFTHALLFIPIGGFVCALILHVLSRRFHNIPFKQTFVFCTLGFATHGLLDASTSYGTQLLWPFTHMRVAWNIISIIDPLFTVPIFTLVCLSLWRKKHQFARAALLWALIYLGFGVYQNREAVKMGREIAHKRGHAPSVITAKPSFGNLIVWKVVYREGEYYFVDAVRVSWRPKIMEGTSVAALDIDRDIPWLDKSTQQAADIERFRWFSNGYIAQDPKNPLRIIDLRYSLLPNQIDGLWSIELKKTAPPHWHVRYLVHRNATKQRRDKLLDMIFND